MTRPSGRGIGVALAVVAGVATAALLLPRAQGFVRSRTSRGVAVHWPGSCIFVQPDSAGSPDLPAAAVFQTVQKSIDNWRSALAGASCASYIQMQYDTPKPLEAHLDGINIVKFRTDRWCHPNDDQQKDVCYSAAAAGITTVFYIDHGKSDDGTILDADVELNDIDFTFVNEPSSAEPRAGTQPADLENTLTHELGHVFGLDHTCKDSATPPQEVDNTGNPPPSCNALDTLPPAEREQIEGATMYNFAAPHEINKRTPEADDVAGLCDAYPRAADPGHCEHTKLSSGGCSVIAGAAAASPATLALLAVAALGLLRLRRRRPA